MPRTPPRSFTQAEIRPVLAAGRASKAPLGLEIEPTGVLELKPLIPMEALAESDAALAALGHRLGRRRRGRPV
jgi:hypothetical protein